MKNITNRLSLPFFLIVGYLSNILFLFYSQQRIPNIPDSIIIGFLSILYGFSLYMKHIKKPDAHTILEEKWEEFILQQKSINDKLKEEYRNDIKLVNDRVGVISLNQNITKSSPDNTASKLGW